MQHRKRKSLLLLLFNKNFFKNFNFFEEYNQLGLYYFSKNLTSWNGQMLPTGPSDFNMVVLRLFYLNGVSMFAAAKIGVRLWLLKPKAAMFKKKDRRCYI